MRNTMRLSNMNRREFLGLAGMSAGALALGGCGLLSPGGTLPLTPRAAKTSRVRESTLEASPRKCGSAGASSIPGATMRPYPDRR
ncbi:MAG TPA: twin-arginine translocation signal domain-containing protein [Rubrobacteraceae bacterium]|nr:twin-arginine translocation signal domain-containing protein [Rubrobacteraceae bacterium]